MKLFRAFRIFVLLLILLVVAAGTWLTRERLASWQDPLYVALYPVNADGSFASRAHIRGLADAQFRGIETYLAQQAKAHGLRLERPVRLHLAPEIQAPPPTPPEHGSVVGAILWSLEMRWWAWWNDSWDGSKDVRLFLLFYDPATHAVLRHSAGLEKARLGVVNLFADREFRERNQVVITHELLHTVGATDKYDLATNMPFLPEGYAEPDRQPLYPQARAALMAGRIPLSADESRMPGSLAETVIGPATAREIGWR